MEKRILFQKFSENFNIMDYTQSEAACLITQAIELLKGHKINQQEIELRLNYTSLSKAKNEVKYPSIIIEKKTRKEILQALFNEFSLFHNKENDRIELVSGRDLDGKPNDVQYFIMHYYAFARGVVDRALIKIMNKRKVVMDYRINEHWEGVYHVIESYTFIEVTKMGYSTPVKKLLSLFSGTKKYGHKYLLGTYSTVKRDGYPAAGRVILESASSEEKALQLLHEDSDYRIVSYLKNNVYLTKLSTPNTLDDIVSDHHKHYINLIGKYHIIVPAKSNTWNVKMLTIHKDFSATVEINNVVYYGDSNFINVNVLNIVFTRKNQDGLTIRKQILNLNINIRTSSSNHIFTCTASSPIIHGTPSAFSAFLVPSEFYKPQLLNKLKHNLILGEPLG